MGEGKKTRRGKMNKRVFVYFIALALIAGCSALDSSSTLDNDQLPTLVPLPDGQKLYEGNYKGEITLVENNCEFLAEEVDSKVPFAISVLQSGDVISVQFEDETEAAGTLKDNKASVVKKDVSESRIYHLEFGENDLTGDCEYIDSPPVAGQLGEYCAKYSLALTKE